MDNSVLDTSIHSYQSSEHEARYNDYDPAEDDPYYGSVERTTLGFLEKKKTKNGVPF